MLSYIYFIFNNPYCGLLITVSLRYASVKSRKCFQNFYFKSQFLLCRKKIYSEKLLADLLQRFELKNKYFVSSDYQPFHSMTPGENYTLSSLRSTLKAEVTDENFSV